MTTRLQMDKEQRGVLLKDKRDTPTCECDTPTHEHRGGIPTPTRSAHGAHTPQTVPSPQNIGDHCCNSLYVGLPMERVRKLQQVQNAAARLLTGAGYRDHITSLLQQLHWVPVSYWVQFKVLVLT